MCDRALSDYANKSSGYEGEYQTTHNDITILGVPEKEPTLEQTGVIQKKEMEQIVSPKPDIDPSRKPDKVLLQRIENGATLR